MILLIKFICMLKIHMKQKNQYLTKICKEVDLKHVKDLKTFIECSNDMNHAYRNVNDYNPEEKRKLLIVFGDIIADMFSDNKLSKTATELFIRGKKLNISLVFIL